MSRVLDVLVVTVLVAASLFYALAVLGPKRLSFRLWSALGAALARLPRGLRSGWLERRLAARAARAQAACGGCGTCGSSAETPGARGAEYHVPVGRITRR